MTARDVFIEFEKQAIEWGRQYQIAKVGDIVTSKLGGKRDKKVKISEIVVTIGRNAHKTTQKTLVINYIGRKLKANGEIIDNIGGRVLDEFVTDDGRVFSDMENEVTETVNDCGLSFIIDIDPKIKEKYPHTHLSYTETYYGFNYNR